MHRYGASIPNDAAEFSEAVRTEFDWSDVPPSTAVVEMVATSADRDPTALKPLYESIDPDALDMLLHSEGTKTADRPTSVTFTFDGHAVTARRKGTVVVRPIDARSELD